MNVFHLTLLGGFELRSDSGRVVHLPTRKSEALLAYLALAPQRGYAREALTVLLWGDVSDQSAGASLRQTLFLIRKTLDQNVIVTEGRSVALAPGALEIDVVEFERCGANDGPAALERAAEFYRGDLLAGIAVNESSFEEWLLAERERLRERYIDVLTRLVTIYGERGNPDRAIQAALRLAALDPLEEATHRALMRLYANAGRRAAALRQYQSCVSVLQRELGAEPAAETKEIYRDILQRQPTLTKTTTRVHPMEPGVERLVSSLPDEVDRPLAPASLIGRNAELLQLREALDETLRGHGQVVMIVGEAGIGKTTILSSLAADASERGSRVLLGRSYESEQILPFAPWVDALQSGDALTDEVLEGLEPVWRAEITRLFPELRAPGLPAPSDDQRRLFESVVRLLEHLAAMQPVVLLLEDLHWADEMSARLLSFLGRRTQECPLLIVATAREEELADASALRRAVDELRREHHFAELKLAPLSADDTAILARSLTRTGTDPEAVTRFEEQIWRMSEGNPFVIVETLRTFGEGSVPSVFAGSLSLPERVREVIARRLERLTVRGQELTAVAAIVGREFDFPLLPRASGMGEREAAEAVEELVRRRVLHAVGDGFDFTHDHIRQAAYGRILAPQQKLLHAQIARALEHLYGTELEPHYAALGLHYEQGAVWDKALVYLRQAGAQAATRSAYREAAVFFERALAVLRHLPDSGETAPMQQPPRQVEAVELRLMLRNALLPLGDEVRIGECLHEAAQIAERLGDHRQLARILSYLCRHFWRVGTYSNAVDAGRRALTLAAATSDREAEVSARLYLGMAHHILGDFPNALDHLRKSVASIDEQGVHERFGLPYLPAVFARTWIAWCLADLGDFSEGLVRARQAIELAESVDKPWDRLVAYRGPGFVYLGRGDLPDAVRFLERSVELCKSEEFPGMLAIAAGHLGYARALSGEWVEGVRLLEQAVAISDATKSAHLSRLMAFLSEALAMAGRVEDALACANRAVELADERKERSHQAWALRALAKAAAQALAPEAEARYREALEFASQLGMRPLVAHCYLGLGELSHVAGKHHDALRHATAAATIYREMDMPFWLGRAEDLVKELR